MDGEYHSIYDKVKMRERKEAEHFEPTFKQRKYKKRPKPEEAALVKFNSKRSARKSAPNPPPDHYMSSSESDSESDGDSDSSEDPRNLSAADLAARGIPQVAPAPPAPAPPQVAQDSAAQALPPADQALLAPVSPEEHQAAFQRVSRTNVAFRRARRARNERNEAAFQAQQELQVALLEVEDSHQDPDSVVVKPEPSGGDGGCGGGVVVKPEPSGGDGGCGGGGV
jgi:hypothetical protein